MRLLVFALLAALCQASNPYAVLGLPRSASAAQLTKAYRALAFSRINPVGFKPANAADGPALVVSE